MSLLEVTQDLAERTQRWRQIEALCGCPIVTNPGLGQLKNMVRVVGSGRMTSSASMSRMPADHSPDDGSSLDDPLEDGRSVTSHFVPRMTMTTSASSGSLAAPVKSGGNSIRQPILESSKESLMASEDIRGTHIVQLHFVIPTFMLTGSSINDVTQLWLPLPPSPYSGLLLLYRH